MQVLIYDEVENGCGHLINLFCGQYVMQTTNLYIEPCHVLIKITLQQKNFV